MQTCEGQTSSSFYEERSTRHLPPLLQNYFPRCTAQKNLSFKTHHASVSVIGALITGIYPSLCYHQYNTFLSKSGKDDLFVSTMVSSWKIKY